MINDQQELLAKLKSETERIDIVSDLKTTAKQLVFGSGNPNADIVLVGEAPGKKEDEMGVPFVGASGRFLDEMLAAAGLNRDDVYITNIVKYRPPNNRDPLSSEKEAFWPFLLRQIEIIDPKVIITLGRHSGECFMPDLKISRDHGQARRVELNSRKYTVVPLYHPAAALYNGSMRQILKDDFLLAAAKAEDQSEGK